MKDESFRVFGVMPVHNEEKYLPFSLGSLLQAQLDGLLIYLDHCTDNSKKIVQSFSPKYEVIVHEETGRRTARDKMFEAYQKSHLLATDVIDDEDVLFSMAADLLYPLGVFNKKNFEIADCVSFYYEDQDIQLSSFRNAYVNIVSKTSPFLALTRLERKPLYRWYNFGVRSYIFKELNGFREVPRIHGTEFIQDFLFRLMRKGYTWTMLKKPTLKHMRTGFRPEKQWEHGVTRAEMGYRSWRVILHGLLYFKPILIKGYLWRKLR